jgi:predicted metal-dependent HD superfamily phosphohydrolase
VAHLTGRWPLPAETFRLRDALLSAWGEPQRSYHDLDHLEETLDRLDELAAAGVAFPRLPVELAAWFHDAVYDGSPDAEERSARWAERALCGLVAEAVVAEVARLVRLTETHQPRPGDRAGEALTDADLAILAGDAERYRAYVAGVRIEYADVPDDLFAARRAEILESLLAKPRLFHTSYAQLRWERSARDNVEAELARLRA